MKNNTQKLSDLTDLQVVKNAEEVKGGFFFFLSHFLGGHGYNKNSYGYNKNNHGYNNGGHGDKKKGY